MPTSERPKAGRRYGAAPPPARSSARERPGLRPRDTCARQPWAAPPDPYEGASTSIRTRAHPVPHLHMGVMDSPCTVVSAPRSDFDTVSMA